MREKLRAFWEHLKTPEGGEIRRHALVGGTVAGLLSIFDTVRPESLDTKADVLFVIGLLAGVFVVGFGLILVVEFWVQNRKPIWLDVGVVDGIWVYGFRDVSGGDRLFNAGSVLRITSNGLGFKLDGHAYRLVDLENLDRLERNGPLGLFTGTGLSRTNTVSFHFQGQEGRRDGSGVGRYTFRKGFSKNSELRLAGEFTGSGLDETDIASRELRGFRISPHAKEEFDGEDERKALLDCLRDLNAAPEEVRITFPRASVIDGWWVDAIYQESAAGWELKMGSIMEFKTVKSSRRFTVLGDTYTIEAFRTAHDPADVLPGYYFEGHGAQMDKGGAEGFYYEYYGKGEPSGRGIGYYEFHRTAEESPTFEGCFLSMPPGQPQCIVFGARIGDNLDIGDRRRKLNDHLKSCRSRSPDVVAAARRLRLAEQQASAAARA